MKKHTMLVILRLITVFALLIPPMSYAQSVNIYAAASLTAPIDQIINAYKEESDDKVIAVYASSSVLARQILRGAPADLFFSASSQWASYLNTNNKLVVNSTLELLSNSLVIAASLQNPETLNTDADITELAKHVKIAIGDPDHVPLGIYTKQALVNLGQWQQVKSNAAFASNARTTLAFIERGAAPIGVVYKTSALASKQVKIISTLAQSSHDTITYPLSLVKRATKSNDNVISFYRFLQSQRALNIFQQFGFTIKKHAN
jgi:molybdate transport system substrate-binding protein